MDYFRTALLLLIVLQADASQRFRMFVTDYNEETIRSFDSDGNEKATYNIPRAGTGLTVIPFDDTNADPNPKLVISDVEEIVLKNGFETKQLHNVTHNVTTDTVAKSPVIEPKTRKIYYIGSAVNKSYIAIVTPDEDHARMETKGYIDPQNIAFHPEKGLLFWTDQWEGPRIAIDNKFGNDSRTFLNTDMTHPYGLAIDFTDDMLYWTDGEKIERCDLDGESREEVLTVPGASNMNILIDGGYLFFSYMNNPVIEKVRLADVNDRSVYINVTGMSPRAMAVYSDEVVFHAKCDNNSFGYDCLQRCNCTNDNTQNPDQSCQFITGECQCLKTWKGERCHIDVDECAEEKDNCSLSQNTVCENKKGTFACVCKKGYAIGMEGECVLDPKYNVGLIVGLCTAMPIGLIALALLICLLCGSRMERHTEKKREEYAVDNNPIDVKF